MAPYAPRATFTDIQRYFFRSFLDGRGGVRKRNGWHGTNWSFISCMFYKLQVSYPPRFPKRFIPPQKGSTGILNYEVHFLAMRYTNLNIRQVVDFFLGGGKWRHTSSQLNCKLETNSKFFGTSCWHLEHQDTANFLRKVDRGLLTKLCFDDSSLLPDALQ